MCRIYESVNNFRPVLRDSNENLSNIEFNQRIIHASEVSWIDLRKSYCTLDDSGDYRDEFKVIQEKGIKIAFASKEKLDLFAHFTNQKHIRLFLIDSAVSTKFQPEARRETNTFSAKQSSFSKLSVYNHENKLTTIQIRGTQVFQDLPREEALKLLCKRFRDDQANEYASFITFDWKNRVVKEVSCDPNSLASYFEKSELPFQTSPVFFKADVLTKYKNDTDKYEINGQIHCKGTWILETYDFNSEGQVHTYICYLSNLPYSEQLYWKSFNEEPKGPLSERAFAQDFEAEFWDGDDPLQGLKKFLVSRIPITVSGIGRFYLIDPSEVDYDEQVNQCQYVLTQGKEDFKNEVLKLSRVLIDPLNKSKITSWARHIGSFNPSHGTLKNLGNCLRSSGIDEEVVQIVIAPIHELLDLRSAKGIAHLGKLPKIENYRNYYHSLVSRVTAGLKRLSELYPESVRFDSNS